MSRLSIENYEELLERALKSLSKGRVRVYERRISLPEIDCSIVGNRTFLNNFEEICKKLRRPQRHVLKFLARELGTAAFIDGTKGVFQGVFSSDSIKKCCERYLKEYVICPVCKRPDTAIVKEKRLFFLICDACGAKSSLAPI